MRFIQTYGRGPLSRHTKWRSETHPPAGNALVAEHEMISEVLERANVFDQLDVPNLSSFECLCRPVPGERGDLETQRARGADRGNGTLHGQASSQRGCVAMSPDLSRCVANQLALETSVLIGAPQGEGGASGKTKAEVGQVKPELGKGTCMHTYTSTTVGLAERGTRLALPAVLAACGTGSVTSAFA